MAKKKVNKINNAFVVSKYYGFNNIDKFDVEKDDIERAMNLRKGSQFIDKILRPLEEQIAILRVSKEKENLKTEYPILLYQEDLPKGSHKKPRLKKDERNINLHIIGTPKSIAEALLIKTAISILEEEGIKDISLEVNSIGGKESLTQFMKELNSYYKKNISELNGTCKQLFKDGAHSLISCGNKDVKKLSEDAPSPLEFLTEPDRKHFSEVIEYLESENIPYEVNKDILGDPHYSTHTVFTILDKKSGKIVATGTRCDSISKKIGLKKQIPSACLSLVLKDPKKVPDSKLPNSKKYNFCFIQLGKDAKFKALKVLETLRKANIPIYQALGRDKLSSQLIIANRNKVPYILLMGQKEAITNSVVVRDTRTHSQISVPIDKLVPHLKELLKKLKNK